MIPRTRAFGHDLESSIVKWLRLLLDTFQMRLRYLGDMVSGTGLTRRA
jgi:hypothetical protein